MELNDALLLLPEQQERMELNRQAALRRLAESRKRQQAGASGTTPAPSSPLCEHINGNGEVCGSGPVDPKLLEAFGEKVCAACRSKCDDYDSLSKADSAALYLLPDDSFKVLRHASKSNPHHSSWTPMKLFLRKHVKQLALRRFGSAEGLEEERRQRGERKLQRALDSSAQQLQMSLQSYGSTLLDDGSGGGAASAPSSAGTGSGGKKGKGPSRKRKLVDDLLSCIQSPH